MSIRPLNLMSYFFYFCQLHIGDSYHIITFSFLINLAAPVFFDIFIIVESFVFREISNPQCFVCPLGKIEASMPIIVFVKSIIPLDITLKSNACYSYKYVFQIPRSIHDEYSSCYSIDYLHFFCESLLLFWISLWMCISLF